MNEHIIVTLAGISALGMMCQWFAWWVRLPAILFLLLTGILLGPITGYLNPDQLFGDILFPLVSLSVAIILFEGSLTLRFDEIKGSESAVWRLVTVGVIISWVVISLVGQYVIQLDPQIAWLLGALVVVTGPTVITPMLRTVRPNRHITNVLRWEGILIDPIGALLAVLVFDFIVAQNSGGNEWLTVGWVFLKILTAGLVIGCASGYCTAKLLLSHRLPEYLHNMFVLSMLCSSFALSNQMAEESGLLAVTIMGIWMANVKGLPIDAILNFKESLTILLISGLFIILAARMDLDQLVSLGWKAAVFFLFIQFAARPIKVFLSTLGTKLTWQEKSLIAWIGPRGIIAAAISSLFALRLQQLGYSEADVLASLTFVVIIGTVILQSLTAKPLANWLGVAEKTARGILIIGANPFARAIGKTLKDNGYDVLLVDSHWLDVRETRMLGLPIFHGSPVSQYADQKLDLIGIERMLGLSRNDDLNILASQRYRHEFGANNIFILNKTTKKKSEKHDVSVEMRGNSLFGEDVSHSKVASLMSRGAEIKATQLTEAFTLENYYKVHDGRAIPLFLIQPNRALTILTNLPDADKAKAGVTIISLISPAPAAETAKAEGTPVTE